MIAAALLAAAAAAPPMPPPMLGVTALAERHAALTGRVVRVRGRLAECAPMSCRLIDDERLATPIVELSLAPAPAFDRVARGALERRVVVDGVVLATCWPPASRPEKVMCPGRAAQFRPLRLAAVLPDAGAPR